MGSTNHNDDIATRDCTVSLKCYESEKDLWYAAAEHYTEGEKFSEMARAALTEFAVKLITEKGL